MELFKTLATLLEGGLTATIVVRNTSNGKMFVATDIKTQAGGACDELPSFNLKGTPEELDNGFAEAIKAPLETVKGLVSNIEAFKKSAQQAEKKATTAPAAKPSAAASSNLKSIEEAKQKAELERKRKEAEAKAKKENLDKAMKFAKQDIAHGNYFTAEAVLSFAAENLTDDKKLKAEIAKQIKTAIAPNKDGFLCNDDADTAAKNLEAFKASMVQPEEVSKAPAAEEQAAPGKTETADSQSDEAAGDGNDCPEDENEVEPADDEAA